MSESLSLLSDGGGGGGVGGGERGGVVDTVEPVGLQMGFWSTELMLSSVVNSLVLYRGLLWMCTVDVPLSLSLCVHRSSSLSSSRVVCGRGGAPSCVGRRKWILRKEGVV